MVVRNQRNDDKDEMSFVIAMKVFGRCKHERYCGSNRLKFRITNK